MQKICNIKSPTTRLVVVVKRLTRRQSHLVNPQGMNAGINCLTVVSDISVVFFSHFALSIISYVLFVFV